MVLAEQSRPTSSWYSAWSSPAPPRGLRGTAQILLVICIGQPSPPSRARQSQPGPVSLWTEWVGSWSAQVSPALLLMRPSPP
eukprot:CAMPEP_0172525488 /NCGR_PEP_ID=MMETSP1067-20121228/524_1 /TAXON_ID=265564 ORGANISM="Thalassiosira punctigera, Strain Tpunct2005C2" /NCGR_SAMPLE_ID=MMETSP1067 /ASSEMBLY_ACC=CAM_ASM_000444 /LENGTH=81 /DNA_ID=CAMNT_0013308759 /DNA_START=1 /DNA_END=243 /DNA_ORIENTATION=-